jgi:hypothetical protein
VERTKNFVVGGAAGKKMCEKEAKKNISERKVKNKNKSDEKDLGYKEVKQGGNNETKKGFYPY